MEHGFFANISKKFLENKPLSVLFLFIILVGGLTSYILIPKSASPEIKLANFSIMLDYPGANRNEVEKYLSIPFEQSLGDLAGVDEVSSISIEGGRSIVNLSFETGVDPESAKAQVLAKLSEEQSYLNELGVDEPTFVNNTSDNIPIFTIGFTSDILSQREIRELIFDIKTSLRSVENITNLEIYGGETGNLQIIPDPDKMNYHKVDASSIIQVIQASNLEIPVGRVKNESAYIDVLVDGDLTSADKIANLYIAQGVQIRDVAEVIDGRQEREDLIGIQKDGEKKEAVFLTFSKRAGTNIEMIVSDAIATLESEMQKEKYANLEWGIYRNEGDMATEATSDLFVNLLESVIIVFVILVLFLHFRPAFNVAISIPFVLCLTLLIGFLNGHTLNNVTLFALVVSLGLLVDAATVVVESVHRHIKEDKSKKEAILHTIDEVGSAMLFSTICGAMGFLVVNFIVGGVMGEYVNPLALFVPFSLFSAFIFAVTLVPYLCMVLMQDKIEMQNEEHHETWADRFFERISHRYQRGLGYLLKKRSRQIKFLLGVIGIMIVAVSLIVFDIVKQQNMPDVDTRQFSVYIDMPAGTGIERTYERTNYVMNLIEEQKGVVSQQVYIATAPIADNSGMARQAAMRINPNQASIKVNIGPKDERDITANEVIAELKNKIESDELIKQEISLGANFKVLKDFPGPPAEASYLLKVSGPDPDIRKQIIEDLTAETEKIEGIIYADNSLRNLYRRVVYEVDHEKALQSGIVEAQIMQSLLTALDGYQVGVYHSETSNEFIQIEIRFASDDRDELSDLDKIYLKGAIGEMVPLISLVDKIESRNVPYLFRTDYGEIDKITAEMQNRSVNYAIADMNKYLTTEYDFPNGGEIVASDIYGYTFRIENGDEYTLSWGGEKEQNLDIQVDVSKAMVITFILIYLILVYKFESFRLPLVLMSTMPLGIIGVCFGFAFLYQVFGIYMSAMGLIGIISLMGIVMNNAIMLIEYFLILKKNGLSNYNAMMQAGGVRLRPILLTSLTTILGTLTIATDPSSSGLAWTIFFGLIGATGIAIFMVPVMYCLVFPDHSTR